VSYAHSATATLGAICLLAGSPANAELPSEVRAWMDESVKPCDNFYYVCGNFIKNSPLTEETSAVIMMLTDTTNQTGKLYASCMNTARIEELGVAPLQGVLKKLDTIDKHDEISSVYWQTINQRHPCLRDAQPSDHCARVCHARRRPNRTFRGTQHFDNVVPLYTTESALPSAANPDKPYFPLTVDESRAKYPLLVDAFFRNVKQLANDAPALVASPKYFAEAEKIIQETDIEVLKGFVNFSIIHSSMHGMPEALRNAQFALRCQFDTCQGDTMGKLVFEAWHEEAGVKMSNLLLGSLLNFMEKRVQELEWLSKETREAAVKKLKTTTRFVGASEVVEEYKFDENEAFLTNLEHAVRLARKAMLNTAGKPVDRSKWMTTDLHHPVCNFAGLSSVIGICFVLAQPRDYDSTGRYHDENGSLRRWWTDADDAEFKRRSQCFIDQYSSFKLTDDEGDYVINNTGTMTLGENIADNSGLRLARQGYKLFAKENPQLLKGTYNENANAGYIMTNVLADGHRVAPARVNGMMSNKGSSEVFQCPVGSTMNPETKCEIW
ncbi:TPA: hypothetical protein N0F65_011788, partial [Lagenidium giganteum]